MNSDVLESLADLFASEDNPWPNPPRFELIPRELRDRAKANAFEHSLTERFAAHHDSQVASPLFSAIPPELRNRIFKLALTEYDDLSKPYNKHSYWYRPDYHFHGRIDTALLLTSRLVYLEARLVPIEVNEHVFWLKFSNTPLESQRLYHKPSSYFERLNAEQKHAVQRLHLFTPQLWLERVAHLELPFPGVEPREIKITIRRTDWWMWKKTDPICISPTLPHGTIRGFGYGYRGELQRDTTTARPWGALFARMRGLKRLVMELETTEDNRARLDEVVSEAEEWRFNLDDDGHGPRGFSNKCLEIERFRWVGTSRFKTSLWRVLRYRQAAKRAANAEYVDTGRVEEAEGVQELEAFDTRGTDGGVPFYIVKLTWDAHRV